MKIVVAVFHVSDRICLKIQVPQFEKKINYFYPTSQKLHKFDEGTIDYDFNNIVITLQTDALQELLINFVYPLKKAINNEKELKNIINIGSLGFSFNEVLFKKKRFNYKYDDIFLQFLFFSGLETSTYPGCEIQTWIYNVNNRIYIEISPSYKWLYKESPEEIDDIKMYQEFIKNYKPITVFTITRKQAQEWLSICEKLIKDLDIYY